MFIANKVFTTHPSTPITVITALTVFYALNFLFPTYHISNVSGQHSSPESQAFLLQTMS